MQVRHGCLNWALRPIIHIYFVRIRIKHSTSQQQALPHQRTNPENVSHVLSLCEEVAPFFASTIPETYGAYMLVVPQACTVSRMFDMCRFMSQRVCPSGNLTLPSSEWRQHGPQQPAVLAKIADARRSAPPHLLAIAAIK